jgi:TolA-binding protein
MRRSLAIAALALFSATGASATGAPDEPSRPAVTPGLATVPELNDGFTLLYTQRFADARKTFSDWAEAHPAEPFPESAIAASYLFEELYRQGVLTSDFFLNEKRFLKGIDGKPDPERMSKFREALTKARTLARAKLAESPKNPEALFSLAISAGMEADADAILEKKHLDSLKLIKEANGDAKELLAKRPDAVDAYVALGCANYIIGSLNAGTRFVLFFGNIHGDKKLGMEQMQNAADNGRYLKPFAKILLALAARREKQNELAQKLLKQLTDEFPTSDLFAAEYAKVMGRPIPAEMRAN